MGVLIFELGMREFKKVLVSNFMVEGVRSLLAFRVDRDEIAMVSNEGGFTVLVFVKETPECMGSDYYAVLFDERLGGVKIDCFKGEPDIDTLKFRQVLYVVNPDKILMGFEEARSLLNSGSVNEKRGGMLGV